MSRFEAANLIRVFDFYLALMFLLGLSRRYTVYWNAVRLLVAVRGRWPRLLDRLKQHHGVLVTAEVLRPLGVALCLMLTQWVLSRLLFPTAAITVGEVGDSWWRLALVILSAIPMVYVDVYFLVRVGRFDRGETEKSLDLAEYWLGTWKAPVVRAVTLGYVNPHGIVDRQLRENLQYLGQTVSWASWWVSVQVAGRVFFGLVIWLLWVLASSGG